MIWVSHCHEVLPNSLWMVAQLPCVSQGASRLSQVPTFSCWNEGWISASTSWGTWGLYNSWGLAVPTTSSPFWWSSARRVLCIATCIIHEGGVVSPRACCSFARIMSFDRTPCRAGLLVTSVVITVPFLITYLIQDGPFQLLQRWHPCPLTQRQAGSLPPLPRGLLSLFSCLAPFLLSLVSEPCPLVLKKNKKRLFEF